MAGALRKTMVYLGLAEEDDTYDRYDDDDEHREQRLGARADSAREDDGGLSRRVVERVERPAGTDRADRADRADRKDRGERGERGEHPERASAGSAAHVASVPSLVEDDHEHDREPAPVRRAEVTPLPRRTAVREVVKDMEVGGVHRITTIHPRTYNEAKKIGESFRDGTPVIMNLTDLDDADAKRLVDFAAGLVFGLQGSIERVTNKVFLLSPANVEVTTDGEAAKGKSLFNQS